MSITIMSKVWRLGVPPSEKLVLMKLADCAHDDGTSIWPTLADVVDDTNLVERHVQRIIKRHLDTGLLVLVKRAHPRARKSGNEYRFNLRKLQEMRQPSRKERIAAGQPEDLLDLDFRGDSQVTPPPAIPPRNGADAGGDDDAGIRGDSQVTPGATPGSGDDSRVTPGATPESPESFSTNVRSTPPYSPPPPGGDGRNGDGKGNGTSRRRRREPPPPPPPPEPIRAKTAGDLDKIWRQRWQIVLDRMVAKRGEAHVRTWEGRLILAAVHGDRLELRAETNFHRDRIRQRTADELTALWREEAPEVAELDIVGPRGPP